jgi:HlyD family secretion protein
MAHRPKPRLTAWINCPMARNLGSAIWNTYHSTSEESESMTLQPSLSAASVEQPVASSANGPGLHPAPTASPNGASLPKPSRLPQARRGRKAFAFILPAAAVVLAAGMVGIYLFWFRGPQVRTDLSVRPVEYKDLQFKIVERGTLEAKDNHNIKCEVKTGNRGAPKIKWVIDNGTYVKPGDLLVDIDDSYLQDQATDQKILRDKAESDRIAAEQDYPSKVSAVELAMKNYEQWVDGSFPQQRHKIEGDVYNAEANVLSQEDRTAWAKRMVKKTYMTASQAAAEEANLMSYNLNLQQQKEAKDVLIHFTDPVQRQTLQKAINDAKKDEKTAAAALTQARDTFKSQESKYKDLLDQIKQCKIYAQNEGIVVYYVPEQTRMGSGANQSIIAQGEPAQYGQTMMSIPDLSHMLVNVRIHEAFINHMRTDLPVLVRVDAVPGKMLKGHVKSVSNVAAAQDWMSPDVKVYPAYVEIDENVQQYKLKPGLSAACTIFTDEKAEHVLAIPVQAVVNPAERGGKPRCYVLTPRGAEMREVELGLSDKENVEIKSGVSAGEEIVLNPRALLNDKEKKATKEDEKLVPTGGKGGGKLGGPGFPGGGSPPGGNGK